MAKFALLSHVLPPSPSGQAVMLYRILSGLRGDEYYLIHSEASPQNEQVSQHLRLETRYYFLPVEPTSSKPNRFGLWRIQSLINLFLHICVRTKNLINVIRQEPSTRALIACSGNLSDIPAGFLASKILKLPFYAYIFDDYVFQWTGGYRSFAKLVARIVFKRSAGMIGPNEFICEEYRKRYGAQCALVRNPGESSKLGQTASFPWPSEQGKIKIVYTGAVYHANYDCFQNLIKALDDLQDFQVELHIFTFQTASELEKQGIHGEKVVVHSHLPYPEITEHQLKADILFLPLAFETPIDEVIRTSAPGKLAEYLASGRPVLAHVPANSFVAYYFEKYHCGLVARENDPSRLKEYLVDLIRNEDLRHIITRNACQRALLDFDAQVAREQLYRFVNRTV